MLTGLVVVPVEVTTVMVGGGCDVDLVAAVLIIIFVVGPTQYVIPFLNTPSKLNSSMKLTCEGPYAKLRCWDVTSFCMQ